MYIILSAPRPVKELTFHDVGVDHATIIWKPSDDSIQDGYVVTYTTDVEPTQVTSPSIKITDLLADQNYTVEVRARSVETTRTPKSITTRTSMFPFEKFLVTFKFPSGSDIDV